MITLDVDKFLDYFDSGSGNPFLKKEVIALCLEQTEIFDYAVKQINDQCENCGNDTADMAYICNFYDDEEKYNIIKKYISKLPDFNDLSEELGTICFIYCTDCGHWQVTH